MNAKWMSWVLAGTLWTVVSSQAVAQPWADEDRRPGRGRMDQGPTAVSPEMEQTDPGAWCPMGGGPRGDGWWSPGFGAQCASRLGLTETQTEKIREIVEESRSRTLAAIKEVLTEEQAGQFEQTCSRAGRFGGPGRGPAMQDDSRNPADGRGVRRGGGRRAWMDADGSPVAGRGRGARWTERPADQNSRPDDTVQASPAPQTGRPMPFIEERFDEADANHDGALTREEIRAFHDNMAPGHGRQRN